jgi:hypothetical protein
MSDYHIAVIQAIRRQRGDLRGAVPHKSLPQP